MLNTSSLTRTIQWLSLAILFSLSYTANGQQGYTWTFATSSLADNGHKFFNSTPALTGSTSSYALTVMGAGTFTTGVSDNPGIGPSCTSAIPIANYPDYTGLEFLNGSPQLVSTTYTIEMTLNFGASENYKRLISFYDLGGPSPQFDYGIYVTPEGYIQFRTGSPAIITGSPLSPNTWYHLAFTRSSSGTISYYKNGSWIGSFTDTGNDLLPHQEVSSYNHYNIITFLQDNMGEDSHGKIARIGIYDVERTAQQIMDNVNSVCSAIPEQVWQTSGNFGTDATHFIGTKNNQPLIFKTNNNEAFRITSTGQVAIGTTNPYTYKLAIGGGMIAEKVTVKLLGQWPDYVFDKKYKLPSLAEVEQYLSVNKHLPGVPSAEQIKEQGIDVGDNQAMLLKKIEELTLYIIEQHKAGEEMKMTIREMKDELEKLKKGNKRE